MVPGDETPRARQGGAPSAGGRNARPSDDVSAEPLRLDVSPETRGVPSSGAGPSQNRTCSGGGISRKTRAGRSTVIYFRFSRTQVCITSISLHLEKILLVVFFQVLWEENYSKQSCKQSYHTFIMSYFRPSFLPCLLRSRNSYLGSHSRHFSPLPTTCYMVGGIAPKLTFCFHAYIGRV